ncbi:MAG: glycoside hydrolase family 28 protein [Limnochordia bacterium]|jgi:polygalacturonase
MTAHSPRHPWVFDVTAFGAVGDGTAKDTKAINKAIEACAQAGGGTVHFPPGRYLTGSIILKSNVTLHIGAGATVVGSPDREDYPIVSDDYFYGAYRAYHTALVSGTGLEKVTVTGKGVIDGQGVNWWPLKKLQSKWAKYVEAGINSPPAGEEEAFARIRHAGTTKRPNLMEFIRCRSVRIEGVTLINSASWTLHPWYCENVTIDGITINNPPDSPNTDGINPESCRHVHISNCHLDVGDDCIALKAGTEDGSHPEAVPCENITITNCTMIHGHGGVVIGSEMTGSVRNVVISNCVFVGTDRGIRIKSRRGRGGYVENVRVQGIVMDGVSCPIVLNKFYASDLDGPVEPVSCGTPVFRNIAFSAITARDASVAGFLLGLPEMPIQHVSFSDTYLEATGDRSSRPAMIRGSIRALETGDFHGLFCKNARHVTCRGVEVATRKGGPLLTEDVDEAHFTGLVHRHLDR